MTYSKFTAIDTLPQFKALSSIIKSNYDAVSRSIPDIVEDKNIKEVARIFEEFLSSFAPERIHMTTNGIQLINKTVRYLLSKAIKQNNLSKQSISLKTKVQSGSDDIEELRFRLVEALTYIEDLESENRDNIKEQSIFQQQIDTLYREGTILKDRFLQNSRTYEDQLSNALTTNQKLDDKYRDIFGQHMLEQEKNASLVFQIRGAAREIESLKDEVEKLKESLSQKKKENKNFKGLLKKCKHLIHESKIDKKRLENEIAALKNVNVEPAPTTLDKMASENHKLQQQIKDLTTKNEALEDKLTDMQNSSMLEKNELSISLNPNKKYDELDDENQRLQQSVQHLKEKCDDLQTIMNSQEDKHKETEQALRETDEKLRIANDTINSIDRLMKDYGVKYDDLPQIFDDRPKLITAVQTLRSSLDAICRFTKKLIEDDTADPQIIDHSVPLFADAELKDEIVKKLEDLQDYVHELLPGDELDIVLLYDAIFGFNANIQALVDNTILKRENNIYSGLVILVSILNKSQKYLGQARTDLQSIAKYLPCKKNPNAFSDVSEYILRLQPPLKRMVTLLTKEFGKIDASSDIADQFSSFMDIVESMVAKYNEIRSSIEFKRSIVDMPTALETELEKLRAKIDTQTLSYENGLKEMEARCNERVEQLSKEIIRGGAAGSREESMAKRFEQIVREKDEKIRKTKDELDETNEKMQELEKAYATLKDKSEEIELNMRVIKNQREKLQESLDQRQKAYEKTFRDLTDASNEKARVEVDISSKRYQQENETIKRKLASKKKKLDDARNALKDSEESFNAIIKQQKDQMEALVQQNERMSKKVAKYKALSQSRNKETETITNEPEVTNSNIQFDSEISDNSSIRSLDLNNSTSRKIRTQLPTIESIPGNANATSNDPILLTTRQMQQMQQIQEQMKQQIRESQQAASMRASDAVKELLTEIEEILAPYAGGTLNWTRQRVIFTIRELVQKSAEPSGNGIIDDSEWKKWALNILQPKGTLTSDEMRSTIKDLLISRNKCLEKLKTLREQKKILLESAKLPGKTEPLIVNMKLLLDVIRVGRLFAKSQNVQKTPSTPRTPTLNKMNMNRSVFGNTSSVRSPR